MLFYAVTVALTLFVILAIYLKYRKNKKIKDEGMETEAVVSRVDEHINVMADGMTTVEVKYYVKYRNNFGEEIEAELGNPERGLKEGALIIIKYLPNKEKYVVMLSRKEIEQ